MNEINQKIIDAVIKKAESTCPNSLELIGLYGSAATGDVHDKSDLDLLILINNDNGQQLADGFILKDTGIGYDLYCTDWKMLEEDAECHHAKLSKLMDSKLLYVKDPSAVQKYKALRKRASDILSSNARFSRAFAAFENAKKAYADCFLTDSVSEIRTFAGTVIHYLFDAVMLCHGKYFKKGIKRTFEEIASLNLSFDMSEKVMNIVQSETAESLQHSLTELIKLVRTCLPTNGEQPAPEPSDLSGTYEEIFSNWRNKMYEAVSQKDMFSSFMNMVSFQYMICDISENTAVEKLDIMGRFEPHSVEMNAKIFDDALDKYLTEYHKIGIQPKYFENVDDFAAAYLKTE